MKVVRDGNLQTGERERRGELGQLKGKTGIKRWIKEGFRKIQKVIAGKETERIGKIRKTRQNNK